MGSCTSTDGEKRLNEDQKKLIGQGRTDVYNVKIDLPRRDSGGSHGRRGSVESNGKRDSLGAASKMSDELLKASKASMLSNAALTVHREGSMITSAARMQGVDFADGTPRERASTPDVKNRNFGVFPVNGVVNVNASERNVKRRNEGRGGTATGSSEKEVERLRRVNEKLRGTIRDLNAKIEDLEYKHIKSKEELELYIKELEESFSGAKFRLIVEGDHNREIEAKLDVSESNLSAACAELEDLRAKYDVALQKVREQDEHSRKMQDSYKTKLMSSEENAATLRHSLSKTREKMKGVEQVVKKQRRSIVEMKMVIHGPSPAREDGAGSPSELDRLGTDVDDSLAPLNPPQISTQLLSPRAPIQRPPTPRFSLVPPPPPSDDEIYSPSSVMSGQSGIDPFDEEALMKKKMARIEKQKSKILVASNMLDNLKRLVENNQEKLAEKENKITKSPQRETDDDSEWSNSIRSDRKQRPAIPASWGGLLRLESIDKYDGTGPALKSSLQVDPLSNEISSMKASPAAASPAATSPAAASSPVAAASVSSSHLSSRKHSFCIEPFHKVDEQLTAARSERELLQRGLSIERGITDLQREPANRLSAPPPPPRNESSELTENLQTPGFIESRTNSYVPPPPGSDDDES
mmetsp:Transcript_14976/g.26935  ORF Transcript_14976/g.26935 Transcript_14976/m.26935 type:complete len:638 (-) Transcript_14976:248-2161(-)